MSSEECAEFTGQRLKQLINNCQMHKHTATCKKKGTHCRFLFPRSLIQETTIQFDPLRIIPSRTHPMVNNFNQYIMLALKANHDIQPLFSSLFESMSALYYMTNYCTKRGPSMHSMLSLMTSSVRNLDDETQNLPTENKVVRLMHRCYNTASNATEFSSAQIASMALRLGNEGKDIVSWLSLEVDVQKVRIIPRISLVFCTSINSLLSQMELRSEWKMLRIFWL